MTATAQEAFTETVRALPPSEQFHLAALILQELTQSEVVVVERSDTWSKQDQRDLTAAALQYAAKLYPEEAAAAADAGRDSGGYFGGGAGDGGVVGGDYWGWKRMTEPQFDITPFLDQDEGQHFDRKSLFEGASGTKQLRDRRAVRDQVAEYVAGFANAEGGILILGIEDDRSITGHRLPANALSSLLATPCARLRPAQPRGFVITVEGHELIVFDVRVLVDLGFARDQGEGIPRMFTEMKDAFLPQPSIEATNRSVTVALRNTLTLNAGELGADTEELGADTEEELPSAIRIAIDQLGPRPRRERLRPLIHAICDQGRWVTSAELAELLNFRQHNLTAGHLAPMVKSGQLERRFPGQPNHPRQAYRAVPRSPVCEYN